MTEINQNPEQIARDEIDARLIASGWSVQPSKAIDHGAARGIAVREYQTSVGPADYALFAAKRALGVVEAKALRKLKHPSRSRKLRSFLDQ